MAEMITSPTHRTWLECHSLDLLAFGRHFPSPRGGASWLDDSGAPDPSQPTYTWITARMCHVYGLGALLGVPGTRPLARAALNGLAGELRDQSAAGWVHSIAPDRRVDRTKSAYTHAFVVLAASTAVAAGLDGADELLDDALAALDRFFDPSHGMYADEYSPDWGELDPYRGVNANMHAVEALLAAADARQEAALRERARKIAERVIDWARDHDWRIPEHFDAEWTPQLDLNSDNPNDQFKPYGATVGHGLEWARLLLHLAASGADSGAADSGAGVGADSGAGVGAGTAPQDALTSAAIRLYERAVADGWEDGPHPGFVYTTDWTGTPVVRTRLHWVAAEAIGAASALFRATGHTRYATDYARWWDHVDQAFIDHDAGSWFHELDPVNHPADGVWPGKPDLYHAFQATLIPRLPLAPAMARAIRDGHLDQL